MLKDDTWLLWLLLACPSIWGLFALVNVLIDRATVVRPRETGGHR
ncbi:hypothetical protein [Streptomyces sp. RKAG337]|nr:hypothetical protein [Streptomyces sp. RKAG337]